MEFSRESFLTQSEKKLFDRFYRDGFIIHTISPILSGIISEKVQAAVKSAIGDSSLKPIDLNNIHQKIELSSSNSFRLEIISKINSDHEIRKLYYHAAKEVLDVIVGNDLAMQNRINLSIQLPNDNSALLPVHADSWSGDSPFEAVVWVPLVDCSKSRSMYILPAEKYDPAEFADFHRLRMNSDQIFRAIEDRIIFLDIAVGEICVFNQNLPHGNITNVTSKTRWSLNCRFKSILAPFEGKDLGEFFEPINVRPMTKIGIREYQRIREN